MAQHDYVISNGTGSAVRSDLNNALSAIVSQNSGATAPATTYAFQFWADTTTNTLKLRNSANSAWIELRQLDGDFTTVSVDNGTAAAPSIYFNASGTDTGIYSSGTDAVDISTAGTRRFGISSSGELTAYGGNLTLNAQGDLRFADSDSSNWVAFQSPATVSSNVTWTLPSADGTNGQALTTNGSGTLSWTSPAATTDKITEGNTEAEVVDTGSDGHFKVTTEGTERFRINSSGNVGIGATTPNKLCELRSTDAATTLRISNRYAANSGAAVIDFETLYGGVDGAYGYAEIGAVRDGTATNYMYFKTSGTERSRIDSSGRLLVGTSTATANGGVLQVSNGITFPATQSTCSDVNTLDDYEEGDFTPTIFGASTAGTSTYTFQLGKYVKIGKQVSITCLVGVSAATGTGEMRIGGLPFAIGTDVYAATAPQVSNLNWSGGTYITLYASPGLSALQPFYNSDDGAQTNQQMVNEAQTFTFSIVYFV